MLILSPKSSSSTVVSLMLVSPYYSLLTRSGPDIVPESGHEAQN
jgi:hypothetical protein